MEALAMGDYGVYVWSCFGLALGVVIANEWRARRHHRSAYRDIEVRIRAVEERR